MDFSVYPPRTSVQRLPYTRGCSSETKYREITTLVTLKSEGPGSEISPGVLLSTHGDPFEMINGEEEENYRERRGDGTTHGPDSRNIACRRPGPRRRLSKSNIVTTTKTELVRKTVENDVSEPLYDLEWSQVLEKEGRVVALMVYFISDE